MNTLESYSVTSPMDKMEECAKFLIDTAANPFVLSHITTPGFHYTFSFWIKSETAGNLIVYGSSFESSETWQEYEIGFTATTANLDLYFGAAGTYYIYRPKLERGNKATDWAPAPEDVDDAIVELRSEFRLEAGRISGSVTDTIERLDEVESDLRAKYDTITKYFTFDVDGLTIGQINNPYKIVIDNDRYSMYVDEVEVLWIDVVTREVHTPILTVTDRFRLMGYDIEKDSEGVVDWNHLGYYE